MSGNCGWAGQAGEDSHGRQPPTRKQRSTDALTASHSSCDLLHGPVATPRNSECVALWQLLSSRCWPTLVRHRARQRENKVAGDPSPSVGRPAVTERRGATCNIFAGGPGAGVLALLRWEALLTQTSNVSALRGRAGDRRWVPIAVALVQGHALLLGRCRCGGCAGQDRSNRQHDR